MGRITPNKPSKRRRNETGTSSSSAATRREDETPPQTPATSAANSSTDSETPRSSLIIPTRTEGASQSERRVNILAPLRDSFQTPRGETSSGVEVEVTGNINIMQQLQEFFQRQEAFNARVEESLQRRVEETGQQRRPRRLPKAVTAHVRDVYKMLADDNGEKLQWDLSKSFVGPENQAINQRIFASVRSTDTETSTTVIKAAMRVHFKTKCRQEKNIREGTSAEVLKMQRVRTRLNTKKNQRLKALSTSTSFTAEQREVYNKLMTTEYMSSEHSMSESGSEHEDDDLGPDSDPQQPRKKVFVISTLPWRSNELGQVMRRLDKKSMRRRGEKSTNMTVQRRREGVVSSRPAPDDAPAFALA